MPLIYIPQLTSLISCCAGSIPSRFSARCCDQVGPTVLCSNGSLVASGKLSALGCAESRNLRTRAAYVQRSLNSVCWPLRSLAGWLTLPLSGYHNPIATGLALVGWPSRSLTECLTLQLNGYCCPIVGIPLKVVLSHAVLLLHLCPDGPTNLVLNYHLYPGWAISPPLSLPGKKHFRGSDHVSVLGNRRWVRVLADFLLGQA